MADAPKTGRRLQFGLSTMFVLVTVFAVWLGWELSYVRERDQLVKSPEFLSLFESRPPASVDTSFRGFAQGPAAHEAQGPPPRKTIPYIWRLVGDKPIQHMDIFLPGDTYTDRDARRIRALFPECAVTVVPADPEAVKTPR
jgi:hypothetical protein